MAKQLPPLNELSLCITCYGCSLLENPRHSGVVKCANYVLGYPEYYRRMNGDYGVAVDAEDNKVIERRKRKEWEKVIDPYWKGD